MAWTLACPDWQDRLREGRSLVPSLPLHNEQADRAVAVFRKLRLADVPGQPTLAEAAGEWFIDILRALFGSLDPATGMRAIRELFCLVPKKNSKTSYGALMMLTALLLNLRPRAKFILTGPTHDVAELAFAQVNGAIEIDETLSKLLHVRGHLKLIEHRRSGAQLEIMTFDPSVLTGQKPAGVLIDELHVSARMPRAANALRQLRGGMLPYPEAFLAIITTQSEDVPAGVFKSELAKARAVRDGALSVPMLPVLYEFPERIQRPPREQRGREPWRDPTLWHQVTPNRGRSVEISRLVEEFHASAAAGEAELRAWASQHLNVEIGVGLLADAWPGAEHWEGAADEDLTLAALLARSEVVTVGIDGGGLDDLLGLTVLGRERGTRRWLWWSRVWAHPIVLKRRTDIAARLLDFAADGDLVVVETLGEDLSQAAAIVAQVRDSGLLPERAGVGLDPAGIAGMVDALAEADIAGETLVGIPQGWRLNGAIKATERGLAQGTLVHADQPLMAWCVGNARVEQRGNAVLITKQAAGSAKIDPLAAGFNAVELMARNPVSQTADGVF
mgnify:CR=1 FL=1